MDHKLIGTAAAASRLRTDRSNLTRWVKAGKITAAHKGSGRTGEFFFDPEEVDRYASELGLDDTSEAAAG